ncbi:class I SAM-dependent methyltransferase [Chitinophaga rhizosphaerae]|uniref:class I SAM-dependent methyltransferase n=1 Tax=Chitinophaga rhizosphaerae TaxID=1864947 RepID=UPI000F80F678|nr:methyltransferase domain-containing protein [Chitinophaga rhizosphaerae]
MSDSVATDRARMPEGTNSVLDRRTVETDNRNLLPLLRPGLRVLDAGCGTGAITAGIAARVAPGGSVTGIDTGETLIRQARQQFAEVPGLHFEVADIHDYTPAEKFGLVSAARVLQWLPNPLQTLRCMKAVLQPGGIVSILDYNHEKISWDPAPPPSMRRFYDAFLQWRKDAGFDNGIADRLVHLFREAGFLHITIQPFHETSSAGDPNFEATAGIWTKVAATRGTQLVNDGYITEEERLAAIADYNAWLAGPGKSMQMYLLAVSGMNPE